MSQTLQQFLRYNAVGIANTLVGVGIIFVLMYLGLNPTKSNLIGYLVGALLSYYLNSRYTFNTQTHALVLALKFFTVLALAYVLNYLTLQYTLNLLNPYLAQLLSATVYTLSSFMFMKVFVFRNV
jgi:putative flippase GtrA